MANHQPLAREYISIDSILQSPDRVHTRPSRISWALAPQPSHTGIENQSHGSRAPKYRTRWDRIKPYFRTKKFWLISILVFVILCVVITVAVGVTKGEPVEQNLLELLTMMPAHITKRLA
ncbi:hypothetical protein BGZ57DRAFT_848952 [Hyaloscypha finlandica]|nr:hypothetical protein BGZ57DRAFT_848952 [Hyaloscypha finlandica]